MTADRRASPARSVVLLTGATGFIGANLLRQFAPEFDWVVTVRPGSVRGALPRGIDVVEWDLSRALPRRRLPSSIDGIVHLAAVRYARGPRERQSMYATNVAGTAALVRYADTAGASWFVHGSTGGVYGYGARPWAEDDRCRPHNDYAMSKWLAERLVQDAALPTVSVVRYFYPYGPGQRDALIPRLASQLRSGTGVQHSEMGPLSRVNPVYIDDACRMTAILMRRPARGVFNCAGPDTDTLQGLARRLASMVRRPTVASQPTAGCGDMLGSMGRARAELGFVPGVGLGKGLRKAVHAGANVAPSAGVE